MRALFAVAGVLQPAVIFIDEIDSILSARKSDGALPVLPTTCIQGVGFQGGNPPLDPKCTLPIQSNPNHGILQPRRTCLIMCVSLTHEDECSYRPLLNLFAAGSMMCRPVVVSA